MVAKLSLLGGFPVKKLFVALVLSGGAPTPEGLAPEPPPAVDAGTRSRVAPVAMCAFTGHVEVVHPATERVSEPVVVTFERVPGSPAVSKEPPKTAYLYQRDLTFVPSWLVVNLHDTVAFVNDDPDFHSVFSVWSEDPFLIPQSRKSVSGTKLFDVAGLVPIRCDIHRKMRAEIFVLKTRYYAIADASGNWRIQAPAGKWKVVVLEPNGGSVSGDVSGCDRPVELKLVQGSAPKQVRRDGSNYKYDP
jgi:plastocyanin